jgi:hypothetical protein
MTPNANEVKKKKQRRPIPVDARSKAWVCGRSLAGIAVSNPHGCWSYSKAAFCQVEVAALGRFLLQRSPKECGVRVSL